MATLPADTAPNRAATPLAVLSSMATRALLAELLRDAAAAGAPQAALTSIGGVDAAGRIDAGEAFDVVALADDALARLDAAGRLVAGSTRALVVSPVALCVRAGAPRPSIATADDVRALFADAPSIGYSTGPSGTRMLAQLTRWGLADALAPRLKQAPPGVPVASLVARGDVALGFQQWSELIHADGIDVLGTLPASIAIDTVFAAAVPRTARDVAGAARLIDFLASPRGDGAKRRHGMRAP